MPMSAPSPMPAVIRTRQWLGNASDRLFRRQHLVQADSTPFRVLHDDGLVKLRYYPPLTEDELTLESGDTLPVRRQPQRTPLVLVPPLAVNMLIYDLFPQRSLVRYLRARGFELYLVDWGRPDRRHDGHTLATYFADKLPALLEQVREHAGQRRLSLHGWSLGGLFSLCYAGLGEDPDLANLVLVGTPTDYHRNGALGKQYRRLSRSLKWLRRRTGLRAHDLNPAWLRSPGWANSLAFKLTSPVASVQGYWNLVKNLDDREFVRAHATNGAFLNDMVAYPGGVIQDIIHYLWVDNVVARGRLPRPEQEGNLAQVEAAVLNITGAGDPIVTTDCSQAMEELVASRDQTYLTIPGGHMGILGSRQAQSESWGRIADWLEARD